MVDCVSVIETEIYHGGEKGMQLRWKSSIINDSRDELSFNMI